MNPGRLTVTFTVCVRNGTPSIICGSGSLVTVNAEGCGSTLSAARTTTSPRLYGPAFAGTTTESPNGAPSYPVVKYTGPDCQNGCEPAPTLAVATPICDAAEHVPSFACGSAHRGIPATLPNNPSGICTLIAER